MRLNLFFLSAAIILLLHIPSAEPDITSDRAALISLRTAVGGRILFWDLSSTTPCSWAGVVCSTDNSSVLELHLPGMGLSGQLPANTLSNLTNLNTLSLRYNSLTGPLPSDLFTSLISLRNLYLQHNSFTGEIPANFFALTSLVRVNLGENRFSGPISPSFNNLTQLGTLYLQSNQFSGSIPDLNLPALQQFDVSNNNLTGQIPASLSRYNRNSFSGNSLCGNPLDSCDGSGRIRRHRGLAGGAIAGIVIGALIGILLILLLVFCLCKVCLAKKRGKKSDTENGVRSVSKEVEIPAETGAANNYTAAAGAKDKEKGVETSNVMNVGGKKGLIFFGKTGWNFDLDDLLRASAEVLGKGTFGTAYKAALENGAAVAVKRLRDVTLPEKEFRGKMEEIGSMDHEYIVPLRAYYYNKDEMLLLYDYLPMGSLSALLHGNKGAGRTPLNWDTRATIALGAARGISYLHSQGSTISHGSIKSSNILLTKSYEARVSDFGLAQLSGPTATPNRIAGYRAPEVTDHRKVSQKADVYSFGVLLLELLTGKAPTHALTNEEGVDLPRWVQSVVREEWTAEVFDLELLRYQNVEEDMVRLLQLAVDCTEQYPDKRPSMADVVTQIEELCRSNGDSSVDIVSEEPSPSN